MSKIDLNALRLAVSGDSEAILMSMFPAGKRAGREFEIGDIHGTPGDSLKFNIDKGVGVDFAGDFKGDLIDLYAAHHRIDTGRAIIELASRYGLANGSAVAPRAPSSAPKQTKRAAESKVPKNIPLPLPPNCPPPPLAGTDGVTIYKYRNESGTITHVVRRQNTIKDGEPTKDILPFYWTDKGWRSFHGPAPRPLYNLHLLAASPESPVIVVEGEKSADVRIAGYVIVTWQGGSSAGHVTKADWSVLRNRTVFLLPDNDDPGRKAMQQVKGLLPHAVMLLTPADAPDKWDIADPLPPSVSDLPSWIARQREDIEREQQESESGAGPEHDYDPAPDTQQDDQPFTALGYDNEFYHYYVKRTGQIVSLKAEEHSITRLRKLAPLSYWEEAFPSRTGDEQRARGDKAKYDVMRAMDSMITACEAAGTIQPHLHTHGLGVWRHGPGFVINDGTPRYLHGAEPSRRPIYPTQVNAWEIDRDAPPASNLEGKEFLDTLCLLRFTNPIHGKLLAGWIYLAMVCGALEWRPHIWITAPASSGKSWVIRRVRAFMGNIANNINGSSTEAFLRRSMQYSSVPTVANEIEARTIQERESYQRILNYARLSSDGETMGNAIGIYQCLSMFMMASINDSLSAGQDERRFTILELRPPDSANDAEEFDPIAHFAHMTARFDAVLTPALRSSLLSRALSQLPTILHNIKSFKAAFQGKTGVRAIGDQLGTLVAGAYCLTNRHEISVEQARAVLDSTDWSGIYEAPDPLHNERACQAAHLSAPIEVEAATGTTTRTVRLNIGDLLTISHTRESVDGVYPAAARAALAKVGIKHDQGSRKYAIACGHNWMKTLYRPTEWTSPSRVLSKLPGATHGPTCGVRVGGDVFKVIMLPVPQPEEGEQQEMGV